MKVGDFKKIILIGPMGAGKSTVGKLLALDLGKSFRDMDQIIEERCGADIAWIFDVEGEQGFRDREEQLLEELLSDSDDCVIATGGGVIERSKNRALLAEHDAVVYLKAGVEHLISRTMKDKKRPLLQVADPEQKIRDLYEYRDPLYKLVSDCTVLTDGSSPKNVVNEVISALNKC